MFVLNYRLKILYITNAYCKFYDIDLIFKVGLPIKKKQQLRVQKRLRFCKKSRKSHRL